MCIIDTWLLVDQGKYLRLVISHDCKRVSIELYDFLLELWAYQLYRHSNPRSILMSAPVLHISPFGREQETYHRSLKGFLVILQLRDRITDTGCSLYYRPNLPTANKFQDTLDLVWRWNILGHIELEFTSLYLVLMAVV